MNKNPEIRDQGSAGGGLQSAVCSLRSAFTLMELLVVMAVIAILMGLSFPVLKSARDRARITRARTEVQALQQAWLAFRNTYYDPADEVAFSWPSVTKMNSGAVEILAGINKTENPAGIAFMEFDDRHVRDGFLDPWGEPYKVELGKAATEEPMGWAYQTSVFMGNVAREQF